MKTRLIRMALGWLAVSTTPPVAAFVFENAQELQATGDFDGDGRADIVIVDRVTGVYRIGYQLSAGTFTWISPRASGVDNVSGLAIGRLLDPGRDALAFTAPDVNRVNVFDASSPTTVGQPQPVFPNAIGPTLVTAIDIGGAGNTAHHDLLVASLWNSAPGPNQMSRIRNNGVTFADLPPNTVTDQPLARGNRVKAKTTGADLLGVVFRGANDNGFGVYDLSSGSAVTVAYSNNLPTQVDYVHAAFAGGSPYSQFVFYKPGLSSLIVRPILEPTAGTFVFGASDSFDLGVAIRQVFTLPGASDTKLLVFFGEGEAAAVYSFDGVAAPALVQQFNAPPGHTFTGAAALGNGSFLAFTGDTATHRTASFQKFSFNGSSYLAGPSGSLPAVNELSGRANVFYFQHEPLVVPGPNLLGSSRAGDFTSLFDQNAAQVTAETFGGSGPGLGNPLVTGLGQSPALTGFGLVNQSPFAPISMFSFAAPVGEEVVEIIIAPPPGLYQHSVVVTLALGTPNPNNLIFYRKNPAQDWIPYAPGTPIWLYTDTTLSCHARIGNGPKKTPIRHAVYQFAKPPEQMDSDGDGVPDFVEIEKGLNPKGGKDSDGDHFSDLCEILSGNHPGNAVDHPAAPCAQEAAPAKIIQGVLFERGVNQIYASQPGTLLRAHDLNGSQLALGPAEPVNIQGVGSPAASLYYVQQVQHQITTVSTEPHFELTIGEPTNWLGRELIALVPVPRVIGGVKVPYVYANGALATEVANWLAAAQPAYASASSLATIGNLEIYDTLGALLVERKIQEILLSRGFSEYSKVTLFPFRANDAGRKNPSPALLLSLEKQVNNLPGFRLKDVHQTLENALSAAPNPNSFAELKSVTAEIYRISSFFNNSAPPGAYPPPVDTLRAFLDSGILHSNYLAATTLNPGELTAAFGHVNSLLALVPGRPTANLTLVVRPDSFSGPCTILDTLGGASTISLWHREGVVFHLLETFELPPGSQVQVLGYTDLAALGCGNTALEVITLTIGSVPLPSPTDTDGDLLLDALELLLFGSLSQNGQGDFDGDGFSNLQEALDGTDPNNPLSKGLIVVNLSPPALNLEVLPGGQLQLNFQFPPAYADKIKFGILSSPALGQDFTESAIVPVNLGGGNFQVILPNPGAGAQFYLVYLGLK